MTTNSSASSFDHGRHLLKGIPGAAPECIELEVGTIKPPALTGFPHPTESVGFNDLLFGRPAFNTLLTGMAGEPNRFHFQGASRSGRADDSPRATNSSRNLLTKLCTGQAQASPKAQIVRPPGMLSAMCSR